MLAFVVAFVVAFASEIGPGFSPDIETAHTPGFSPWDSPHSHGNWHILDASFATRGATMRPEDPDGHPWTANTSIGWITLTSDNEKSNPITSLNIEPSTPLTK